MPWPMVPAPSTAMPRIGRPVTLALSSEFVINVPLKRGGGEKWIRLTSHVGAGACLVRLTCTALFILYPQPKTPTDFTRQRVRARSDGDGIMCSIWNL